MRLAMIMLQNILLNASLRTTNREIQVRNEMEGSIQSIPQSTFLSFVEMSAMDFDKFFPISNNNWKMDALYVSK